MRCKRLTVVVVSSVVLLGLALCSKNAGAATAPQGEQAERELTAPVPQPGPPLAGPGGQGPTATEGPSPRLGHSTTGPRVLAPAPGVPATEGPSPRPVPPSAGPGGQGPGPGAGSPQ